MDQETTQELFRSECHESLLATVRVVFPAKRDLAICEINQPVIGDGHPMCVAREIVEDVLWPAEWWLGINHPVLLEQRTQEGAKRPVLYQWFQGAGQAEITLAVESLEPGDKLATENTA